MTHSMVVSRSTGSKCARRSTPLLICFLVGCGSPRIESRPLSGANPTEYTFDSVIPYVQLALRAMYEEQFDNRSTVGPISKVHLEPFSLEFHDPSRSAPFYPELLDKPGNENDVLMNYFHSPMEDSPVYSLNGKPVPYLADFYLHIESVAPGRTLVRIQTLNPEVIAGLTFFPGPHGSRANIYVPVRPTTIEEYRFLLQIGAHVGQKNMPALISPSPN